VPQARHTPLSGSQGADALRQAPADDLVGIKMDYKMKNICGVNEVTVTMLLSSKPSNFFCIS